MAPTKSTVASAGGSVYAAAMAEARQSRQSGSMASAAVYDASISDGSLRR
jgi:hypothetical protein